MAGKRKSRRSRKSGRKRQTFSATSWSGEMGGAAGGGRVGILGGSVGRPLADFAFTVLGAGQQVEFNGGLSRPSPISLSPIVSYEWVFFDGTGTQATGINATHTFAQPPPGTGPAPYSVQLRVVDANGEQAFRTQAVPIPDPPQAPPLLNQLPTPPAIDASRQVDDVVVDVTNALDLQLEGSLLNFTVTPVLADDNPTFDGQAPTLPLTINADQTFNGPTAPPGLENPQFVVLETVLPNGNSQTSVVAVEQDGTVTEVPRSPVPVAVANNMALVSNDLVRDTTTGKHRYERFTVTFNAVGSQDGQGNLLGTTDEGIDLMATYGLPTQNASQTNLTYLWSTNDPALAIDGANNEPFMKASTTVPGTYQVTLRVLNPTTEEEAVNTIDVAVGVQLNEPPDVSFVPLGGDLWSVFAQHTAANQTGLAGSTRVVVWDGANTTQANPLFERVLRDNTSPFGVFEVETPGPHSVFVETVHV